MLRLGSIHGNVHVANLNELTEYLIYQTGLNWHNYVKYISMINTETEKQTYYKISHPSQTKYLYYNEKNTAIEYEEVEEADIILETL